MLLPLALRPLLGGGLSRPLFLLLGRFHLPHLLFGQLQMRADLALAREGLLVDVGPYLGAVLRHPLQRNQLLQMQDSQHLHE
ncbi:MAG TPA: hypothetical protein VMT32_01255 [Bryobacteraceae bacterium]|nr:hypothetical protein [Bryobacteraceae bacterium]